MNALCLLGFGLLPLWVASIYVWQGSIGARSDYWTVANNEDLKQRAIALVRSHPAVLQEFGADFQTGLASMTTGSNERPKRLEVRVSSEGKRLYAIVDVSGDDLSFACLTPVDMGQRSSGKHPCEQ